jgi:hypothetical protein
LLPYILGQDERTMVLSKKDGKTDFVTINERDKDGMLKNDIGSGDFDVELDTGPSFAVQKEIALEFLQTTLAANPQAFPLIADLWAKNLDVQFMPQIAERFKTMVPPQILAKEEGKTLPPQGPSPQEQMMQMEMASRQADIKNKMTEVELKAQKLHLEKEKAELDRAELLLEAQKVQSQNELNIYDHQLNLEKARVTHGLDHKKTDLDFRHKISQIMADIYKHKNPNRENNKSNT